MRGVPRALRRGADALVANPLTVILLGAYAIVISSLVAPWLYGGDYWLNVVGGREIVEHGLPSTNELTVLGAGREWIAQQWLSHLLFHATQSIGGLTLSSTLGIVLVVAAFAGAVAGARLLGASRRGIVLVLFLALLAAPTAPAVRAQLVALLLYTGVLVALLDGRNGVRARTLWALPLIVVWANVHGSAPLGAVLATLLAAIDLARRGKKALPLAAALAIGAWTALLVTPYGPAQTLGYYRLMLVDAPLDELVTEWQRTELNLLTAPFWLLAGVTLVLALRHRRALGWFERGTLVLTLVAAVQAVRGIAWFVLAAATITPVLVDRALGLRDHPVTPRPNRVAVALVGVGVACSVAVMAVRGEPWLESRFPTGMLPELRRLATDPDVLVFPNDLTGDWILARVPALRGRIAYDTRLELLTRDELLDVAWVNADPSSPRARRTLSGYDAVVVDAGTSPEVVAALLAQGGGSVAFQGEDALLLVQG